MPRTLLLLFVLVNLSVSQIYYTSPNCSFQSYNLLPLQYNPNTQQAPVGYSFNNATTQDMISINFCAQVSATTGCTNSTSTNPANAVPGACQNFPSGTGTPQVLGDAQYTSFTTLQRNIVVNGNTFTDGVILTYTDGAYCQKYSTYRQTQIAVVCPPPNYNGPLNQIIGTSEPANCVFQVLFVSEYGCGYYAPPSCSYEAWDLLPLQYNPNNYSTPPSGYSYFNSQIGDSISINFCAQVSGCNGATSPAGSCLTSNGIPQNVGDATKTFFSPILNTFEVGNNTFSDGVILTYYGGAYCPQYNMSSTTKIIVACPPKSYNGSLEQIYSFDVESNCFYNVLFVSQYGCNYYAAPTCSFGDYNLLPLQYDPLSTPPPGYSYFNSQTGDTISINFCAQVSAETTGCNFTTSSNPVVTYPGSCQTLKGGNYVIGDATKSYFSPFLGPIEAGGVVFTQGVILTYSGGSYCSSSGTYRTTEIIVACPPTHNFYPLDEIFITNEYGCFFQVIFVSSYGCS